MGVILSILILAAVARAEPWCSPGALAASNDGRTIYIACETGRRVEVFDVERREVIRRLEMPAPATGLVVSPDSAQLYVTCAAPKSSVQVIDTASWRRLASIPAGHTSLAPVLDSSGATLYISNRFDDDVSVIDTAARQELSRIRVEREPLGAALSSDGKRLFVINSLPTGRADVPPRAAAISVIDTATRQPAAGIPLPNGSTALRGISASPDGRLACVTHLLSRYYLPTTQIERGWIQTNAISIIDMNRAALRATLLLDEVDRGAANPWAVAWSTDGTLLFVTHAGTHELSVLDVAALLHKLEPAPESRTDDLAFLLGVRRRVPLQANGPRALARTGGQVWVAGYFSDTLEVLDPAAAAPVLAATLSEAPMTMARRGEMLFNDGSLSMQGWLSCASCHTPDARVDALNWDLLNDGIGNPKNARSLLLAHRTPPAMSHGIREDAEAAVRAGIRYILFARRPEEDAVAMDEFLKSLHPVPSPFLANGKLSAAAERGRRLFLNSRVGCATCHPPGLLTDLHSYDVGTRSATDTVRMFDTPTLVEIWRTAPYLHDGSAATLRDVVTTSNRGDRHGRTSQLAPSQIDDLVAYLRSL